jgi:subtilisin family serine protease
MPYHLTYPISHNSLQRGIGSMGPESQLSATQQSLDEKPAELELTMPAESGLQQDYNPNEEKEKPGEGSPEFEALFQSFQSAQNGLNNCTEQVEQLVHQDLGITGDGVGVIQIEALPESPQGSAHAGAVAGVLHSVAPGTQGATELKGFTPVAPPEVPLDTKEALDQYLIDHTAGALNTLSGQLDSLAENRDPNTRIVNLSTGVSRAALYDELVSTVNRRDDGGEFLYPEIREEVLGTEADSLSATEQYDLAIAYVDEVLDESPQLTDAQQRYVETTRRLAEDEGMVIIASAGNEGLTLPENSTATYDAGFNLFAESPYVISVAASDPRYTATDTSDDRLWAASSEGNPTVAAPGANILLEWPDGPSPASGTSYAAPYVAGTVALMLEANPELSNSEVRTILQESCTDLPDYGPTREGSGVLNPVHAVQQATRLNRQREDSF